MLEIMGPASADYRWRQVGAGRLIFELSSRSTRSVEHDPVFAGAGLSVPKHIYDSALAARSIASAIKPRYDRPVGGSANCSQ